MPYTLNVFTGEFDYYRGTSIGSTMSGGTTGSVLFIGASSTIAQDNTNFFWDDTNNILKLSKMHIGATSATLYPFNLDAAPALSGTSYLAANFIATYTPTANFSESVTGFFAQTTLPLGGYDATGTIAGGFGSVRVTGSGTVNIAAGMRAVVTNINGAIISDAIGYRASTSGNLSTGSITRFHAFQTPDQTAGVSNFGFTGELSAGANKWNLYMSGTAVNYMEGALGIGQNAPVAPIHVGGNLTNNSVDSQILISRDVDATVSGNGHAFSDSSLVTRTGTVSYNSFDCRINFGGTANYGHYAGFQYAPTYASSGTMTHSYSLYTTIAVSSGTVTNHYGLYAANSTGAGTLTNNYGVYVADLTKGSTINYGIYTNVSSGTGKYNLYSAGTAQSYIAGDVGIGVAPSSLIQLQVAGGFTDAASSSYGSYISNTHTLSAANNAVSMYGVRVVGILAQNNRNATATSSMTAGRFDVQTSSGDTGTVTGLIANNASVSNPSDGVLTNAYNYFVNTVTNTGAGSITNTYGLYIAAQTAGTNNYGVRSLIASGSNNWNLYLDGTAKNYIAGNVGIGSSAPVSMLTVGATNGMSSKLVTVSDVTTPTSAAGASGISVVLQGGGGIYMKDNGNGVEGKFEAYGGAMGIGTMTTHALGLWADNGEKMTILAGGNVGIGNTSPAAVLHLKAGTATASTAPIKLTSGTFNTTAEAGAMEYNNVFALTESDTTRRYIVQAASSTKTTAGAPYTNDGYVTARINGVDVKLMTTA